MDYNQQLRKPNGRTSPPEAAREATSWSGSPGCLLGCVITVAMFLLVATSAVKLFQALSRVLGGPS
jgi:hypothetical protein